MNYTYLCIQISEKRKPEFASDLDDVLNSKAFSYL